MTRDQFIDRLNRAIKTDRALYFKDQGWLYNCLKSQWPDVLQEFWDAYGQTPFRTKPFVPTPEDIDNYLPTMGILAEYLAASHNKKRDWRIINAKAMGFSYQAIADKLGRRHKDTVRMWYKQIIDDMMNLLTKESAHKEKT